MTLEQMLEWLRKHEASQQAIADGYRDYFRQCVTFEEVERKIDKTPPDRSLEAMMKAYNAKPHEPR